MISLVLPAASLGPASFGKSASSMHFLSAVVGCDDGVLAENARDKQVMRRARTSRSPRVPESYPGDLCRWAKVSQELWKVASGAQIRPMVDQHLPMSATFRTTLPKLAKMLHNSANFGRTLPALVRNWPNLAESGSNSAKMRPRPVELGPIRPNSRHLFALCSKSLRGPHPCLLNPAREFRKFAIQFVRAAGEHGVPSKGWCMARRKAPHPPSRAQPRQCGCKGRKGYKKLLEACARRSHRNPSCRCPSLGTLPPRAKVCAQSGQISRR